MIRTAILHVRDSSGSGGSGEAAVAAVREILAQGQYTEVDYQVIGDEQAVIRARLRLWADDGSADLILTFGGIGAAPRHRTPEATLDVVERQFPGIPEVMRAAAARVDVNAGLWRVVAGLRRATLIINLPDEAASARVALEAIAPLLVSATATLAAARARAGDAGLGPEAGRRSASRYGRH